MLLHTKQIELSKLELCLIMMESVQDTHTFSMKRWLRQSNIPQVNTLKAGGHGGFAHFLGLSLFSFKYCSSFYLRMVCTYSHTSIAHLERFVQDGEFLWTVNYPGHFLIVITNVANAGGAGGRNRAYTLAYTFNGVGV